jgi:ABC-type antimicrobial peptide transport system permease subunit
LLRTLWLIGAFILLIACVNFINLSTAHAANRSKEIGIRKVLGSNKTGLKFQFLTETFLTVFISIILAALIAVLTLPFIGKVLSKPLSFNTADYAAVSLFLFVLLIVVTALAGFYPSVVC